MLDFEDKVWAIVSAGIAVELLVTSLKGEEYLVGVRLRTFGKKLPKDKMVLAGGATFNEALDVAIDKARAQRWERLDWSARPWEVPTRGGGATEYGFLDAV